MSRSTRIRQAASTERSAIRSCRKDPATRFKLLLMIAAVFVPGSLLITSGAHVPSAARYELGTWVAAGRRGSFLLPCSTPEGTAFVSSRPGINIMVSSGTPLLHCPFATCMRVSAAKGKLKKERNNYISKEIKNERNKETDNKRNNERTNERTNERMK